MLPTDFSFPSTFDPGSEKSTERTFVPVELSLPVRGAKGANELPCQFRASTLLRRRAIKRVNSPSSSRLPRLLHTAAACHPRVSVSLYISDRRSYHSFSSLIETARLLSIKCKRRFFFWATKSDVDVRGAIQQGVGTAT